MFTIKVQVIRNAAHRPSTQASYTIGSGTTMQENQPQRKLQLNTISFLAWRHICHKSFGAGRNRFRGLSTGRRGGEAPAYVDATVGRPAQSCPRVIFLGPDPTRPGETSTRPDPRLLTKILTRPDPTRGPTLTLYV